METEAYCETDKDKLYLILSSFVHHTASIFLYHLINMGQNNPNINPHI